MATLEDKLLGEKLEYYCSSSEGEDNDGDADDTEASTSRSSKSANLSLTENPSQVPDSGYRQHTSINTGPKGVVQDWQRFKQLETERRTENERQRMALAKKLTMTVATAKEDEERKKQEEVDEELAELMSEDFLQQYQKQRMTEMLRECGYAKKFGQVQSLNTHEEFLSCIEQENKHTTIIIHIYDRSVKACLTLNNCLDTLASEYPSIKFAKICSSVAGMSRDFRNKGLPALLVYKAGTVIGNFVRLTDELSDDFFASDVESFLIENGVMVDKSLHN